MTMFDSNAIVLYLAEKNRQVPAAEAGGARADAVVDIADQAVQSSRDFLQGLRASRRPGDKEHKK